MMVLHAILTGVITVCAGGYVLCKTDKLSLSFIASGVVYALGYAHAYSLGYIS